jgi:hypothetical protein
MSEFPLCIEQVLKQEQYKDLIRDAEHYRTIKAVTQSEPKTSHSTRVSGRRALVKLARRIPILGPMGHART